MTELSNILDNGKLISYEKWCKYVDSLKTKELIRDEKNALLELQPKIEIAVQKRIPNEKFGVFFSGGIDSTLIAYLCKRHTTNFICYTVGIQGSKDVEFSSIVSNELKLKHKIKILSLKEAEKTFENTAKILGKDLINIVNIGVGGVVLAAIDLAKKDNVKFFFFGLGSEEIFAGYQRHEKSNNVNEECWKGLKTTWQRDFRRDYTLSTHAKIKLLTPFLDKELIISVMKIEGSLKIKNNTKKHILRKVAEKIGLKKEFSFRPKTAAQYGSNFDKAISKITKSKGFKYKREYLDYLASLCDNK